MITRTTAANRFLASLLVAIATLATKNEAFIAKSYQNKLFPKTSSNLSSGGKYSLGLDVRNDVEVLNDIANVGGTRREWLTKSMNRCFWVGSASILPLSNFADKSFAEDLVIAETGSASDVAAAVAPAATLAPTVVAKAEPTSDVVAAVAPTATSAPTATLAPTEEMKNFIDPVGMFTLRVPKRFFTIRRTAKGDLPDEKTGIGRRGSSIFTAGDLAKTQVVSIERSVQSCAINFCEVFTVSFAFSNVLLSSRVNSMYEKVVAFFKNP